MTKPDFATDPTIAAELDRAAKRIRDDRRIRDEIARRWRLPDLSRPRPLSELLPRTRRR